MRLQRTGYGHSDLRGFQAEVFMEGSRGASNHDQATRDPHVQQVVKAAHEELRQLMRQRSDIMKRIGTVKQTIIAPTRDGIAVATARENEHFAVLMGAAANAAALADFTGKGQ